MFEASQFIASLSAAIFAGAAIYTNVAEHPARSSLDPPHATAQWALSYRRATWMQAPLAVVSFLAGMCVWLLGGGTIWLIAAILIGSVVPITFIVIMPTNRRLLAMVGVHGRPETRHLLERWGKLHGIRSDGNARACLLACRIMRFLSAG